MANLEVLYTELKTKIEAIEAVIAGQPQVQTFETDIDEIVDEAGNYIKVNGLQDVYSLAKALLLSVATQTPWAELCANLASQAVSAGIALAKGAEAIVLGKAQADLLATGSIASPTTNAPVAPLAQDAPAT